MNIDTSEEYLIIFEALASPVRLAIISLLSKKKMNIKEIANQLKLSSAIITMHIKKLEEAQIIKTEKIGQKKVSTLLPDFIKIDFPEKSIQALDIKESSIPIGHYTNYQVEPTCGIATIHSLVGSVDEPKFFMDADRMNASLLWFSKGFVEYQTPNYLSKDQTVEMLEFSLEIASEYPFSRENWPSDITFFLNQTEICTWTSPGDYADKRGRLNPSWYPDDLNQYGLLKTIRITPQGTFVDDLLVNPSITLSDIQTTLDIWTLKIEVKEEAVHSGGCTLYGRGFGNYNQDINLKIFYS